MLSERRSGMKRLLLGLAGLLLVPAGALAAVDLDIAFDPTEACPGEDVQFFFALENVGGEDTIVELAVTFAWDGEEYGPFVGQVHLPAGGEISKEIAFRIPPPVPPGTLTVTVEASDVDGTVTDTAELTILDCSVGSGRRGIENLNVLPRKFQRMLENELGVQ
jgi:hypothetical protein